VFLVVGCFLDAIPAIIIVGTILEPLARRPACDPVHFAMIGIVSLAFGLVTPPYGLCLMIACSVAGIRMVDALRDTCIMLLPDAARAGAAHRPGLGAVAGLDLRRPALKLPGLGRLGLPAVTRIEDGQPGTSLLSWRQRE
jgi:hypothetical protein